MIKRPRSCVRCKSPIPKARRRGPVARFCSSRCRCRDAQDRYKQTPTGKGLDRRQSARYHRKHRQGSPEYYAYRYRINHGFTLDEYSVMLAKQGGVCAKCGAPPNPRQRLCATLDRGAIKPMVCFRCNSIAAWVRRSPGARTDPDY